MMCQWTGWLLLYQRNDRRDVAGRVTSRPSPISDFIVDGITIQLHGYGPT